MTAEPDYTQCEVVAGLVREALCSAGRLPRQPFYLSTVGGGFMLEVRGGLSKTTVMCGKPKEA